ncbi:MAG TPA: hypothetical protein PKM65_19165 [Spirochaetota bacterium]|nr:hypothetical protein [Spirochaetota bacterium]HNT11370.1 hypothetical protein [Spirochaetota bacterium]HOS40636.1 hypothetical protein [Spirochaetota bacterium]
MIHPIALAVMLFAAPESSPEYLLTLQRHAKQTAAVEWTISIARTGEAMVASVTGYRGRTKQRTLSRTEYLELVEKLNRCGIWTMRDRYPKTSPNGWYALRVSDGVHSHGFVFEDGVRYTGAQAGYAEITRLLTNLARRMLED